MPELPEVETIRRQLENVLIGQKISDVQVRGAKSFIGYPPSIVGKRILTIGRRAKVLMIELNGDLNLLIHLKMTGQLIYQESGKGNQELGETHFNDRKPHFKVKGRIVGGHPTDDWVKSLPTVHTRVILTLDRGVLFFNDMRMFGWIKVINSSQLLADSQRMPPDVVDDSFTLVYFHKVLARSRRAIKVVLLDQKMMGGIGNIYANDALWKARVNPHKPASALTRSEVQRLFISVREVIAAGIQFGGASESTYKHINGLGGKYQEYFLVYKQEKQPCARCGTKIKKIILGGRGTYFCPKCQSFLRSKQLFLADQAREY